ncbi:MAG: hypothetical protein EXS64_02675 [Candidatus Latescibacteria bacterium]|nr:hypothetical protein [Candidatus Latescibacterota bacterium]
MNASKLTLEWLRRVIPLPKEAEVRGVHTLATSDVALVVDEGPDPLLRAVREEMAPFAKGREGRVAIRFALTGQAEGLCAPERVERLKSLPHADQACCIVPAHDGDGAFSGLAVIALTELGLLYGARTLRQMMQPTLREGQVTIPELDLTDWPDVGERGQWGGSAASDLAWLAERKFNVVEVQATLTYGEDGVGHAEVTPEVLSEAARVGIQLVPYVTHLELLFLLFNLFKKMPQIASTPDPDKPLPSDYTPGICFSKPDSTRVLGDWLTDLAGTPGVTDLMVWLSEDASPCFCEQCRGREPFGLEVQAIARAFERARAVNPRASLRILLTQGSYAVNDLVLEAAPKDVKITYYHGGLTYDSSHRPMITPRLEAFAKSGRWLGVYPQVTTAWRAVTPFTGPQFIRARMNEFAAKRLSNVITYAVPANRFHAFNVTAAAEWLWNSRGRTDDEFARVWAQSRGIGDPKGFARWATAIGPVGWNLAGSRIALQLIFSFDRRALDGEHPLRFGEGILAEIHSETQLRADLHEADRALALALEVGDVAAISESRIVRAFLVLAGALQALSEAPKDAKGLTSGQLARYRVAFEEIDQAARTLEIEHFRWAETVAPGDLPGRLLDTIAVGYRTAASAAGVIARLGLADPTPEFRPKEIGGWSSRDFEAGPACRVSLDLSRAWTGPGPYVLTFEYTDGAYGVTIRDLTLVGVAPGGGETELGVVGVRNDVNRWEKWREVRVDFPEMAYDYRARLYADLRLPEHADEKRRISNGRVVARRGLRTGSS